MNMRRNICVLAVVAVILSAGDVSASNLGYPADICAKYVAWSGAFGVPGMNELTPAYSIEDGGNEVLEIDGIAISYDKNVSETQRVYMMLLEDGSDQPYQVMKFCALVAALEYDDYPVEWSFYESCEMMGRVNPAFELLCGAVNECRADLENGKYVAFYTGRNGTYYLTYKDALGWGIIIN